MKRSRFYEKKITRFFTPQFLFLKFYIFLVWKFASLLTDSDDIVSKINMLSIVIIKYNYLKFFLRQRIQKK